MRWCFPLVPLLVLAACGQADGPPNTAAEAPAATTPAPPRPDFTGRWAADPELCADGAWTFRPDGVSTAGEVSCEFREIEPTASGYRIAALCRSEGHEEAGEIGLAITDPAQPRSMTVTGGPWNGPLTLRRCVAPPA